MLNIKSLQDLKVQAKSKLDSRLKGNKDVEKTENGYKLSGDYYKKQLRIAMENCDIIDPENIDEYIALDGYKAIADILSKKPDRKTIIEEVKKSGLRGRGGAGFPTGKKWAAAELNSGEHKYIICNADEGDPGAYMDRSILEKDPHCVLEGMAIAGYAIGADIGYVYVRAEYPVAVKRLKIAIEQATAKGLLGDNILGSDFSFHINIRLGAGAFVCGEGTALMESIMGRRGMPRNKEFRTAERGLFNMPTVINNVETLANVPRIIRNGADWFSGIGTKDSTGTKVFALVGKVANAGLVEVPMGTTIKEIVYDIGGGAANGKKVKAVQTGGPSGGCIPTHLFDTKVDFGSLAAIGSIMGSGGMVVMDEDDCMVDIAKFFLDFTVDESCGKCTPCRIGNKRLLEMLEAITSGKADLKTLKHLEDLSHVICETSLCGLGQTAPNPILSTLRYFRNEYESHVVDRTCPSHVCKKLAKITITYACIGCGKCKKVCPVDCISGEKRGHHTIDAEKCIKCESCISACPVHAIINA